ncbi:MAG: hypothetical protein M1823_003429 [Watsoniomyces obsoletus]|nr:MAG: hypothetical protein M1823_003429 [Watsoniomyces obsoletus]
MAEAPRSIEGNRSLNLTPEERRTYGQLFKSADREGVGVVTGDVAAKFFEKSGLDPRILGKIWEIADTENRGFLTPTGFGMVLRLIGHVQNGREPVAELAFRPGPLPQFDGIVRPANLPVQSSSPTSILPQSTGGPIRVPPLTPERAAEFAALFTKSGAENGVLPGYQAKQIFERARLPVDVLERIWNLADTQQAGVLTLPEFVIAMHLLTSFKSGAMRALPHILPTGLYDAAARLVHRRGSGSRSSSAQFPPEPSHTPIPRQFSGQSAPRPQSPLRSSGLMTTPLSAQATGTDWAVSPADKAQFDSIFATVDKAGRGFISGDDAVRFFGNSKLPAEVLAQIWDLACIQSNGQLNRDEFAVAMYLIRQQRAARDGGNTLPPVLPPNLIPPNMRQPNRPATSQSMGGFGSVPQPAAVVSPPVPPPPPPRSAADDLFGLDVLTQPAPATVQTQTTGGSASFGPGNAVTEKSRTQSPQAVAESSVFKPFVPSSSWGQNIIATHPTGTSVVSDRNRSEAMQSPLTQTSATDDLLSDHDPEINKKLTAETAELGNLSNQVGILSNQMQEVKSKRTSAETELSKATAQKRDFEIRLAQLRTVYEKEVEAVRNLEEQLNTCRNETAKIRREVAMIEGTYQDLQHQHRHAMSALEADQKENAQLKERIRTVNGEIEALKPQLEKAKSEGRQMRGLVAINKKQLSTVEGERDRLENEIQDAKRANEAWPEKSDETTTTTVESGPDTSVTSPSTNPFARFSPGIESPFAAGAPASASAHPHASAFDDLFGPSLNSPANTGPAPPTSFAVETGPGQQDGADASVPLQPAAALGGVDEGFALRDGQDQPSSASTTTPSRQQSSTSVARGNMQQQQQQAPGSSLSTSSVFSALDRPSGDDGLGSIRESSNNDAANSMSWATDNLGASGTENERGIHNSISEDRPPVATTTMSGSTASFFSIPRMPRDAIPGAFPEQFSTPMEETPVNEFPAPPPRSIVDDNNNNNNNNNNNKGTVLSQISTVTSSSKDDFDAAFAEFDAAPSSNTNKQPRQTNGVMSIHDGSGKTSSSSKVGVGAGLGGAGAGAGGTGPIDQEFPPIQELEIEDDSDDTSEDDQRFDDDFTPVSPSKGEENVDGDNEATEEEKEGLAKSNQPTSPSFHDTTSTITKSPTSLSSDSGKPVLAPSYLQSHPFKNPPPSSSSQSQSQQQQQQQMTSPTKSSGFDQEEEEDDDFDQDFADLAPAQESNPNTKDDEDDEEDDEEDDRDDGLQNEAGGRGGGKGGKGGATGTTKGREKGKGMGKEDEEGEFDLAFDDFQPVTTK